MASLPTQSFNTIVTNIVSGIQGRASKLVNFAIGSTLRAIAEGFAGLFLWFQALVLQLLKAARLSTAQGTDVDTFTADFMPVIAGSQTSVLPNGSPRLGAQFATGQLTFSRLTAAPSTCFIPAAKSVSYDPTTGLTTITNAGPNNAATAQSSDGSQKFVVIADTTNGSYSSVLGGYTLAANVASIIVAAQAQVPGAAGNVTAGNVSVLTSAITGIDTVVNVAAFANGANQESDNALKARFAAYILGLSRGDYYGTAAALKGTAVTMQFAVTEFYNFDGSYAGPGYYFIVVDDGSGNPPSSFLAAALAAANSVRPLGNQVAVFPPVVFFANVGLQITTASGYDHNTVVAVVAALIANNINALGLGNALLYSVISAWAYSVPGVTGVNNVTINGVSGDASSIAVSRSTQDQQSTIVYATVKAGTISVS